LLPSVLCKFSQLASPPVEFLVVGAPDSVRQGEKRFHTFLIAMTDLDK